MDSFQCNYRWLAYELHDGLLPWLHGAQMQLSSLSISPEGTKNYQLAMHCLKLALEEGRSLTGFLEGLESSPTVSLESKIQQLVAHTQPMAHERAQQLTLQGTLGEAAAFSPAGCWAILRIVQQALHNAMQHAGPTEIRIDLRHAKNEVCLQVVDGGCGFDTGLPQADGHFGLASMRQRTEAVGGRLKIISQPGHGTQILLTVPTQSTTSQRQL